MHQRCRHQQASSSVHYTTSCKHSLVFLRMDEIIGRNMLSWLKLLIKLLLLHLVGCLYYYIFNTNFRQYPNIQNFTKIRPVGAELFHSGGRTDRHEANSCFWAILLMGLQMFHFTVKNPRENILLVQITLAQMCYLCGMHELFIVSLIKRTKVWECRLQFI